MPVERDTYRIILCNDGATLSAPDKEAPIGVAGLIEGTIAPLRHTAINTLYWQLGTDPFKGTASHRLSDWFSHDTAVGARWGDGFGSFRTASEWRSYESARALQASGTDALHEIIRQGHLDGLEVFASHRINDGSDYRLASGDLYLSPQRRLNPAWLLGDDDSTPEKERIRYAYNFMIPEVRAYTLALLIEAIEKYDIDGIDIDFCRQPLLFKETDADDGAALITDMLASVQAALASKSEAVGRKLLLSVRVPHDLGLNKVRGLDVAKWISSGLVQIVIVSDPRGANQALPIAEFRKLTEGMDCIVVAQNLCAFKEPRPASAKVLFGEKDCYEPQHFRATAARHYGAGAQGQFIWNQHFLKFIASSKVSTEHWSQIGSPQSLSGLDKHYMTGGHGRGGPLPLSLSTAGDIAHIPLDTSEDARFAPAQVLVRLLITQLTVLDRLEFFLDGSAIFPRENDVLVNYNDTWLSFDISATFGPGNVFTVLCSRRNELIESKLLIEAFDIVVTYK